MEMQSQRRGCLFLTLMTLVQVAVASHYRGGIIMVEPTYPQVNDKEVEIYFRESWRRDSPEGGNCDQTVINSASLIGLGSIDCQAGCVGTVMSAQYYCTDFSITDNWSFGERREVFIFSPNDEIITIGYQGCCWVIFSADWNTVTTMSLAKRNDTGRINSTPRAITSLNIKLLLGCNHTIAIPVTDPDYDIVKCRWASGYGECGGVCNAFPGAILNEELCTLSYEANNGTGLFAVALMIEDFIPGSSTPLSSVSLQFMVEVFSSPENCSSVPVFIPPTLPQGSCVAIPPNSTYNGQLFAYSGYPGAQIIEINTVSPAGLIKSPIFNAPDPDVYYMDVIWTPLPSQYGEVHGFCFVAINSVLLASQQVCIQLSAGDYPPTIIQSSLRPSNNDIIPSGSNMLHLDYSKPVERPHHDARMYIKEYYTGTTLYAINFFDSSEVSIYNHSHVKITPNFAFPECTKMYIELQKGVVIGLGCNLESDPVTDKDFWSFSTQCKTTTTTATTTTSSKTTTTTTTITTTTGTPISVTPCVMLPCCCPCGCHDDPCDDEKDDDGCPCEPVPCNHDKTCGRYKRFPSYIRIDNRPNLEGENNIVIQKISL